MIIIILIVLAFFLFISPIFRCALINFYYVIYHGIFDFYNYFKLKKYNIPTDCNLVCYMGTFGKGKTLSSVHYILKCYKKYHNKIIWDNERNMFVTQYVKVLSNVELNIPYLHLTSLEQIVSITDTQNLYDYENNIRTVTYVLIDECSVLMNSRDFKSNINAKFLSSLLTARHYHFGDFVYTSQRFNLVDKLLRDVTTSVYDCNKIWRFQRIDCYNAWEMENASNVQILRPLRRLCWFVLNKDFSAYNTFAIVGDLKKDFKNGSIMSDEEILSLQIDNSSDDNINYSKRFIRKKKKMTK